jgi:hypothetical protein
MTGERDLLAIGFQPHGDGSLHSPARVVLSPVGEFYRVNIELPGGDVLTCHVSKRAIKLAKQQGEKA